MNLNEIMRLCGIDLYGVCDFNAVLPLIPCRNVKNLPENPISVICCTFPYFVKPTASRNLSYYACVPDYHTVVSDKLKKACEMLGEDFVPFCDNSPIREVYTAALCGLGVIGRNNLLITEKYGSYVFLGCIVTSKKIPSKLHEVKYCENCGNCVKSCPTGFLSGTDDCLSRITQKKGELTDKESKLIVENKLAWGCDICQTSCHHNKNVSPTYISEFTENFNPFICYENIDKIMLNSAMNWRGKKVILRNLDLLNQ